jgi:hypothetical protein
MRYQQKKIASDEPKSGLNKRLDVVSFKSGGTKPPQRAVDIVGNEFVQ